VVGDLRVIEPSFVVPGPSGVAVRTRLKGLSAHDVVVLREVGGFLGFLAGHDLAARCRDGAVSGPAEWAARKRVLSVQCSSRWAGAITKASNQQWALSRRSQQAHLTNLAQAVETVSARLSRPVGKASSKQDRLPAGYASRREWFTKSRRLVVLEHRREQVKADREQGRVRVVRGGGRFLTTRHHLTEAQLSEEVWRGRWEAARWFFQADGESGKRFGNETIRISTQGQLTVRLPAALAHLANAPHGRYLLDGTARFTYRGREWADRIAVNGAVAYRIDHDPGRDRWYVTASWQPTTPADVPVLSLEAAGAHGVIGVDMNADHLAAWRLDAHGNPVGNPRRFDYTLSGTSSHRDAQIRHALTRLLHWARACGVSAIAVEDLDFETEKTREKHGRKKRFRSLLSQFPNARLRARLVSMAATAGITVIAVDPAYTSKWGAAHWRKPLSTARRAVTRHQAASVAIGRRALGLPVRRRTAPPPRDRSDHVGHRTVQAPQEAPGREEPRPRAPGPRTRSVPPGHRAHTGDQRAQHRPAHASKQKTPEPPTQNPTGTWIQDSLLLT
jgi:IS605 OrfB family transposase